MPVTYRADHIGSLLRPAELLEARRASGPEGAQRLREVEDALRAAPEEFKPPLQLVRVDLTGMNDELLRLLFPRQPNAKPDGTPDAKPDVKEVQP